MPCSRDCSQAAHQAELCAKLSTELAASKQAMQDLQQAAREAQAEHERTLQQRQHHAAKLEAELRARKKHRANQKQQLDSLLAAKQGLMQQNQSLLNQLAGQSAALRKEQHKLELMRSKAVETDARLAAADQATADAEAALRKLQDLGQLHASQALSDLRSLCQLIGESARQASLLWEPHVSTVLDSPECQHWVLSWKL